jgi:hypothetical protein
MKGNFSPTNHSVAPPLSLQSPNASSAGGNSDDSSAPHNEYSWPTALTKQRVLLAKIRPPHPTSCAEDCAPCETRMASQPAAGQRPQVQPCRYKTGKTLGAGSYSVVKECVHIDTGRYYAAKVINKRLMAGREHMVSLAS